MTYCYTVKIDKWSPSLGISSVICGRFFVWMVETSLILPLPYPIPPPKVQRRFYFYLEICFEYWVMSLRSELPFLRYLRLKFEILGRPFQAKFRHFQAVNLDHY